MAQENRCYYHPSFKSAVPGQTERILKKMPHRLEPLLYASGNSVSLVLFSDRWAGSGTGAGFLPKQDFCDRAACVHARPLQPPLNTNRLFNPAPDFDQTWQRGEFTEMLPSYIFNENKRPGRGKRLCANPAPKKRCRTRWHSSRCTSETHGREACTVPQLKKKRQTELRSS